MIQSSLEHSIPAMLLYVVESKGSSPGRQGFFMAVNATGEMEGSIGGGIMEHKFVEMAKERLQAASHKLQADVLKKQVHDKKAEKDQSGMICSGEQTIILYQIKKEDLDTIKAIIASLEKNENGTLQLEPGSMKFSGKVPKKDFQLIFNSEKDWQYEEKTGYKNKLFIVGGGHCALALSKLMSEMDFYISVFDDRKDLKTMNENATAIEKHIVDSYTSIGNFISGGANHYVVIMTFGYRTDDLVIRALLGKSFGYLGVLGSKHKMEKLFSDYKVEGIDPIYLQSIHTPVGLTIHSQTPEEIAVSIAAEIIKCKNAPL